MSYAYGGKKTRQEKEYIGMVKSYYEGTQRSRQERPGEVAENSSGTAGIERPQAFARISVEVEDALKKIFWGEVESFLLENFFHPHHLCWGIIMELWCFLVRHAESDMGNAIIDQLCTLMKTTVSWESVLDSGSVLRKLARSISMLVKHGSHLMTDRVFNFITNSNVSKLSSAMYIALLMEGFPLNGLSDKLRSVAKQRLLTEYFNFVDVFDNDSSRERANVMFAALQSLSLRKELANVETTPGSNELALLVKEGLLLKQMAHKMMTIDSDAMEIDDTTHNIGIRATRDQTTHDSIITQENLPWMEKGSGHKRRKKNKDKEGKKRERNKRLPFLLQKNTDRVHQNSKGKDETNLETLVRDEPYNRDG
ncbi:RNA polymerase II assembly factor like protein [Tanacetum coccineum]